MNRPLPMSQPVILLSCPELATEASCELPVPSFTTEGVMGELPDCCIESLGAVCELLALPVMNPETVNAPHICPVNPVIAKDNISKLSSCPVPINESNFELPVCPVTVNESGLKLSSCPDPVNESNYELPVCQVTINESGLKLSPCPVPINESNYELPVCPVTVNESGFKLSSCPDPVNDLNLDFSACPASIRKFPYGLSALSVATRENINVPCLGS